MESTTPPPWKVPPSLAALWCMAMMAAKYIGLWGQISSLIFFSIILKQLSVWQILNNSVSTINTNEFFFWFIFIYFIFCGRWLLWDLRHLCHWLCLVILFELSAENLNGIQALCSWFDCVHFEGVLLTRIFPLENKTPRIHKKKKGDDFPSLGKTYLFSHSFLTGDNDNKSEEFRNNITFVFFLFVFQRFYSK